MDFVSVGVWIGVLSEHAKKRRQSPETTPRHVTHDIVVDTVIRRDWLVGPLWPCSWAVGLRTRNTGALQAV